jgi:glutamate synthase (ferredoxin)
MRFIAQEVRELMAQLGFRTITEMVGHTEVLEKRRAIEHWKAQGLDFSSIFYQPEVGEGVGRYCQILQDHELEKTLDLTTLLDLCKPAIEEGKQVRAELPIKNINRTVGTITGSELTKKHGAKGLPDDTIKIKFNGSAGQSFGAFIPPGMTLELEGDANDYIGKGLSGGKLIVYPPKVTTFDPAENILIGNVALYGATSGEAYFNGVAGERFCVRNSGALAVVEGVGDHGCEYMTGGRAIILGKTGRNFAAGMSGGVAYVLDVAGDFATRCNKEMVALTSLEEASEIELVKSLIHNHAALTGSKRAADVLLNWDDYVNLFVRVMPNDYARVLESQAKMRAQGLPEDEAVMAAFEMNAKDVARAGGK